MLSASSPGDALNPPAKKRLQMDTKHHLPGSSLQTGCSKFVLEADHVVVCLWCSQNPRLLEESRCSAHSVAHRVQHGESFLSIAGGTFPEFQFPVTSQGSSSHQAFLRAAISDLRVSSFLYNVTSSMLIFLIFTPFFTHLTISF